MSKLTELEELINQIEEDQDFKNYKDYYEKPNCFCIEDKFIKEEWHSKFICWLLDPSENHGLNSEPLKLFLKLIEKKAPEKDLINEIKEKKIDIAAMNFQLEEKLILEEINYGRIDIYGEEEKFILAIENKIGAGENEPDKNADYPENLWQTEKYYDYFFYSGCCYGGVKCYIYLTASDADAKEPHCEEFVRITHQELYDEVIRKCIALDEISKDTKEVLEQYEMYISNPNIREKSEYRSGALIHRRSETVEKIYYKHEETIKRIRDIVKKYTESDIRNEADKNSVVYNFFYCNWKYLNEILLSLSEEEIVPKKPTKYVIDKWGRRFEISGQVSAAEFIKEYYKNEKRVEVEEPEPEPTFYIRDEKRFKVRFVSPKSETIDANIDDLEKNLFNGIYAFFVVEEGKELVFKGREISIQDLKDVQSEKTEKKDPEPTSMKVSISKTYKSLERLGECHEVL